jgi:hypothetical protein
MTTYTLSDLAARLRADVERNRPEAEILAPAGVWNLSQTLQHCAQTIRYAVTGYPELKPPLFRLTVGALAKRVFLRRDAMKHPLSAPIDGAPALNATLPVPDAVDVLGEAIALFTSHTGELASHPAYGPCTHDEFARLHAMHIIEHLPGLVA